MILVCFPHYTCGGLLCDIIENKFSEFQPNGGLASFEHGIGKIGDSIDIYDDFDPTEFYNKIKQSNANVVGTHCHPKNLNLDLFEKVFVVTTVTNRSKIYRWLRAYHHYFLKKGDYQNLDPLGTIDKQRETAKNYLKPFNPVDASNVINIEFSEVVENSVEFRKLFDNISEHVARWRVVNHFIYDSNLWHSDLVHRFYEAEFEVALNKGYIYE